MQLSIDNTCADCNVLKQFLSGVTPNTRSSPQTGIVTTSVFVFVLAEGLR